MGRFLKRLETSPSLNLAFVVGVIVVALGCGDASNTVSVSGQVSHQGEPLSNAALMFFAASGKPLTAPVTDGEYAVELPPGEYRVTVALGAELPPGWKEGDPVPPATRKLPPQFSSRLDTPLKATVNAESGSQPVDFTLP
jgi:hypothetical protein